MLVCSQAMQPKLSCAAHVSLLMTQEGLRPRFPIGTPYVYQSLAERCWQSDWEQR
jgi:hypothetical protein